MCPIFDTKPSHIFFPDLAAAQELARETRDCERFTTELGIVLSHGWDELDRMEAAIDKRIAEKVSSSAPW